MCEHNAECQHTIRRNWPAAQQDGEGGALVDDVTELHSSGVPDHHILTAGFPCQSFTQLCDSRAGVQAHRTGWDERTGSLVWHVMRIAAERRPDAMILENVRGLLTIDQGATLRTIVAGLRAIGYEVEYRLLNSSSLLAQHRARLYFVCVRADLLARLRPGAAAVAPSGADGEAGGFGFPWPVLPELNRRVKHILEPESAVPARHTLEPHRWSKVSSSAYFAKFPEARLVDPEGGAQTVGSSYKRGWQLYTQFVPPATHSGSSRDLPRFFTPREVARLQGFPEKFDLNIDNDAVNENGTSTALDEGRSYHQLGNAVSPPVRFGPLLIPLCLSF